MGDSGELDALLREQIAYYRARAIKVPHEPAGLERIGWRIEVRPLAGPFFRGSGGAARDRAQP
jgi:hypothetical protein